MNLLYQFPPAMGLPNASPPCLKLELFLRMAGIPYENRYSMKLSSSPTGKFPCLKDDVGTLLVDSELIIRHFLDAKAHDLDEWLSAEQQAVAHAFSRMLNEHLYWAIVYSRWVDDRGWSQLKSVFFGTLPFFIRPLAGAMVRNKIKRDLYGQGLGRHSAEVIYQIADSDLAAVAQLVGDKPYALGDKPCSLDACIVGHVANIMLADFESPLEQYAVKYPNLERYCRRVLGEYFTEHAE